MSKPQRQTRRKQGNQVAAGASQASQFWKGATVAVLAEAQGVQPVRNPKELWGDFWPEDESLDAFVEAIRESRRRDAA